MNPPVVPHPNICRAGVVAHIALVHLLHTTFCNRGQMKQTYNFLKMLTKIIWHLWQQKNSSMEGKLMREDEECQRVI